MKRVFSFSLLAAPVLLLSFVGLLSPAPAPGQAQELLGNPSFEDGTAHWTVKPGTAIFDIVTAPVHGGSKAALLTKIAAPGYALIRQEVAVTTGQGYVLEGWAIWNDPSLSDIKLRLEWLDGPGGTRIGERLEVAAPICSADWQSLTIGPVTAPSGATVARVECYTYVNTVDPDDLAYAYFDDLSFTESLAPRPDLVKLNEFLPAPESVFDDEWVELYNGGPTVISLNGWRVKDALDHSYALCAASIAPGAASPVLRSRFSSFSPNRTCLRFDKCLRRPNQGKMTGPEGQMAARFGLQARPNRPSQILAATGLPSAQAVVALYDESQMTKPVIL